MEREKLQKEEVGQGASLVLSPGDYSVKTITKAEINILTEDNYRLLLKDLQNHNLDSMMKLLSVDKHLLSKIIGVSESSIRRFTLGDRTFRRNDYKIVEQFLNLIYTGIETFDYIVGDFVQWMHIQISEKDNQTPIEIFINEPLGYDFIIDRLKRIEYSIYS